MMSFTADAGTEPPKDVFRLWAAKPPFADESGASWIQRLCGDHQYSFQVLGQVLGYLPYRGDWDLSLDAEVWHRLVRLVTFPDLMRIHGEMALLGVMSQTGKPLCRLKWLDNKPAYRWCPTCFAGDQMPYLRWYWRLDCIRECWVHHTPLCEKCVVCGQPFLTHRTRLVGQSASLLSECAVCGMSLASPMAASAGNSDHVLQRKLKSLFAPWWVTTESRRIDARLIPEYVFLLDPRARLATARSESNLRRRHELLKRETFWVLDASCFQENTPFTTSKTVVFRAPWQWKLSPRRRLALAGALWSLRSERRANLNEAEVQS